MLRTDVTVSKEPPFKIATVRLTGPDIPVSLDGYRLLHLTDFHYGPTTNREHLEKAISICSSLDADAALLTGDYIQVEQTGLRHFSVTRLRSSRAPFFQYKRDARFLARDLGEMLGALKVRGPICATYGNHDYLEGIHTIRRHFPKSIRWLRNESTSIQHGEGRLRIAGLDDYRRGTPSLPTLFSGEPDNVFTILLSHNPDLVLLPEAELIHRSKIVLCGHTHGGQICFPYFGPLITRTKQKLHVTGLTRHSSSTGTTPIYVSNGVGYGLVPLRILCPPEITLLELRRSAESQN